MKNKKHLVLSLCVTLLVSLFAVFAVSCGGKDDATYDENGSYYTYVNNEAVNELVLDSGNFTLKLGSDNFSGKYTLKDGKLTIKTSDADIDAVFANDTVAFTYDGANYILYKDVDCTVSFVIEGGKTVAPLRLQRQSAYFFGNRRKIRLCVRRLVSYERI